MASIACAMTIAGSDSGGGAGIQADLRTFAFHCVHGTSALTCVTAQNTVSVNQVISIAPQAVAAQIATVLEDIKIQSAKTGMLLNREIMAAVVEQIDRWQIFPLVVDPVMVSRSGVKLIDEAAIAFLHDELVPRAQIVTPNRYEAQLLSGISIETLDDMQAAAQRIFELGAKSVVVKGGGMTGNLKGLDIWYDGDRFEILTSEAIETPHTHGTGCTLSAAIAANLALGYDSFDAVKAAKKYVTEALKYALAIGQGTGPVGHFYPLLAPRQPSV
jgi:hydroxymethylpyrimidine/phosphomethylpyrimidine kinase